MKDGEIVRVEFQTDGNDHMKLARNREESSMATIKLARGGPGALQRCPTCDGPYDVLASGVGWATCPHCDVRLHFDGAGGVFEGGVIAASQGDGLSPVERRLARHFGISVEDFRAAKL